MTGRFLLFKQIRTPKASTVLRVVAIDVAPVGIRQNRHRILVKNWWLWNCGPTSFRQFMCVTRRLYLQKPDFLNGLNVWTLIECNIHQQIWPQVSSAGRLDRIWTFALWLSVFSHVINTTFELVQLRSGIYSVTEARLSKVCEAFKLLYFEAYFMNSGLINSSRVSRAGITLVIWILNWMEVNTRLNKEQRAKSKKQINRASGHSTNLTLEPAGRTLILATSTNRIDFKPRQ